jgi:hypothetical protein
VRAGQPPERRPGRLSAQLRLLARSLQSRAKEKQNGQFPECLP